MHKYVFWLGTNAELSRLELFAVWASMSFPYRVVSSASRYLVVETEAELADRFIDRLGGVERIGKVIGQQDKLWQAKEIFRLLSPTARKIMIGLSKHQTPGFNLMKMAKELKSLARRQGVKMNYVLPQGKAERLNAAQVIFNHLGLAPNAELTVWQDKGQYYLARTEQGQDIQAYEKRDTQRPVRDMKVGMMPPKLAQMMLNLVPHKNQEQLVIYDPCCGLGSILQEGWLMGYQMVGSDESEKMINASGANLLWLSDQWPVRAEVRPIVFKHDINQPIPLRLKGWSEKLQPASGLPAVAAKSVQRGGGLTDTVSRRTKLSRETGKIQLEKSWRPGSWQCDAIVTEPYLGPPLLSPLSRAEADKRNYSLVKLYLNIFRQARAVLRPAGWIVLVLPALVYRQGKKAGLALIVPQFVDEADRLGYICHQLGRQSRGIIYARPDALVAREITLWQKQR